MKRRNFLKAIGLGALVAPAVVSAASEKSITVIKPRSMGISSNLDIAMHKAHIQSNPYVRMWPEGNISISKPKELWPKVQAYWESERVKFTKIGG